MEQWATILFTDEFLFILKYGFCQMFVWRESVTRYLSLNVREIDLYGGGGLIICSDIMLDGRSTSLHIFERGTMTAEMHRDEVLEPYVRFFRCGGSSEFNLMEGNSRLHRALLVEEFQESEDIHHMDLPSRFSDLDPLGHVSDAQGRATASRNPPPRTIQCLKTALLKKMGKIATGTHTLK